MAQAAESRGSKAAAARYGGVAQALHWLVAALVLSQFGLGWTMSDLPLSQLKFDLYQLHKSLGLTIFALVVVRLAWRLGHPPPPLPTGLPAWERTAARTTHALFYVLLLVQPLIGLLQSNAANFPVVVWGILPVPALIGSDEGFAETLVEVHETVASVLLVLIALHVAAALRHHFLLKDDVLRRMLPAAGGRR
jgi:cytochrome b561